MFRYGLMRPTRVRYGVVAFAVSLAVITYLDRVCISFAAPAIRHDLGLTAIRMGWAFTAFNIGYALFEIPGGFLGDWIGPRKVLTRIVLWWSFFTAATGWAWSHASLVATRFLFGAGEAGCFPNLTKAFTTWLPAGERVRAQGILWLAARWGGAFTPPLVAVVMGLVGWRHSFEIFGCVGVVWAAAFYFWYRDNPLHKPKMNGAERELLRQSSKMASGHGDVPWGRMVRSRQLWMLCWQFFALNYGWYFNVTWLPTYLREERHLAIASTALLSMLPLFMGGLGNPVSVFLTARLTRQLNDVGRARRMVARLGFVGAGGFLFFSTRMPGPLAAMLAIGMASFCNDFVMPVAWSSAADIGGEHAGTLSGAMNMWGNLGGALSPIAIGYMLDATHNNWNLTFYVSAAVYLTGAVFWSFLDPVTPLDPKTGR
jgi:MFS family permease